MFFLNVELHLKTTKHSKNLIYLIIHWQIAYVYRSSKLIFEICINSRTQETMHRHWIGWIDGKSIDRSIEPVLEGGFVSVEAR